MKLLEAEKRRKVSLKAQTRQEYQNTLNDQIESKRVQKLIDRQFDLQDPYKGSMLGESVHKALQPIELRYAAL